MSASVTVVGAALVVCCVEVPSGVAAAARTTNIGKSTTGKTASEQSAFFQAGQSNRERSETQASLAAWIWHDEGNPLESLPSVTRYFRKTFKLERPEKVVVDITCDDRYELFVNGDPIGQGEDVSTVKRFDVSRRVRVGTNVVAVKAVNDAGPAGLLVRVLVTQRGGTQLSFRSDTSWRSHAEPVDGWSTLGFDDSRWSPVRQLGNYGEVAIWKDLEWQGGLGGRFHVPSGFVVEEVASAELTGSVVNMTFDGQGRILFSREGGAVFSLADDDGDGVTDSASEYATQVQNCQGLLWLDGDLYAVGDGPDKTGLYRLSDTNRDGGMDASTTIGTTRGGMGEHGPHAIRLGPDGWLYWDLGNHAHIAASAEPDSPLNCYYEGDFLRPRYEDAGGHAVGIKAPGGTIVRFSRSDTNRKWYRVAGGFRNQFDFAFSASGEMFTFDSDMEWDVGLPWYRPVRVNHAVPGAEFGWRSGAAKWPPYYFDSLPAAVDIGRGSPTGVVFYHHKQFPEKYYDAFFISDWAQGIIYAVHLQRDGATWKGDAETFATGNPLNVTDIEVGPDGALYFSCGGRGTEGGIFRIVYPNRPQAVGHTRSGVERALRVPQPGSAWARARIKQIQEQVGPTWDKQLEEAAAGNASTARRIRALDLLQAYGPPPSTELLVKAAADTDPLVRAHAAYLLGVNPSAAGQQVTARLLRDPDALVRRRACEAIVRAGMRVEPSVLVRLLGDSDRWVRFAAGRALRDVGAFLWRDSVLQSDDSRVAIAGMLALLQQQPEKATLERILQRQAAMLQRIQPDDDLLDLLRTVELSLLQTGLTEDQPAALHGGNVHERLEWLSTIRDQLVRRYPARDRRVGRELIRMLAGLREPRAVPKLMSQLATVSSRGEQIHLALCARYISQGWSTAQKRRLFQWFDEAHRWEGGHSFSRYIENIARDCLPRLDESDRSALLADGAGEPFAAGLIVAALTPQQARANEAAIIALYGRLLQVAATADAASADRNALTAEVVGALGRAGTPAALAYLRKRFEDDPDRRQEITRVLADNPSPENWEPLLRSLDLAEGETLRRCLVALQQIDRKPENPSVIRSVIIAGLRLGHGGQDPAGRLLSAWVGPEVSPPNALDRWQAWFAEAHPDLPPAVLPRSTTQSRWAYDQLLAFLTENADGLNGDADRGATVFEEAQCVKCHRFGNRGEGIGPDLTTVRRRFRRKEILEAMFYPSQIISDQYRSAVVITKDGLAKTGLVAPQGEDAIVVLDAEGNKTVIAKGDIEEQFPANTSAMPEGLLNPLTLDQIADLFAYLERVPEPAVGSSAAGPP